MKRVHVREAVGKPLFHDMTAISEDGCKGPRFKRGHVIREEDIPVFLDMGKEHIFIWEEDPNLVHEEDAAEAVVRIAAGENMIIPPPSEGRFSLRAARDGVFVLNKEGLININSVPDYTFATLRHGVPVKEGDIVVGARIVPLVTTVERVEQAKEVAQFYAPVFSIAPYRPLKTAMVITGGEIYSGRIKDAFAPILRKKIAHYGGVELGATICPDDVEFISNAVKSYANQGADLILMTGGMSVDPDDVTPTVIRSLADKFLFQGLPVQPGNMLTVGYMETTMLVGVPGASMHSPVTSLDLFLPMIYGGVPFSQADAISMGEGGLSICRHWP
ncbi:MAG TPA: molybdopterin-binding protein [Clostridiaceae bacterium]|nr:molybdopterin-binding protein [Clostridiaceae bacterium]